MHTVRKITLGDGTAIYRIIYYDSNARKDNWVVFAESTDLEEALAYASYLNGGSKPPGPPPSGL